MTPWRKRLGDLRVHIEQACTNYLEPELFRININSAIQTLRTVTFIIQKHKDKVRDFDSWYTANVLQPFKDDRIMEWLKDSRNSIEKHGDLDVNSECHLEAVYSYTDSGPRISLKDEGHLFIGLMQLLKRMRTIFPEGVFTDAAISIERKWIATTLPDIELTDALIHGYSELYRIVTALDRHVGVLPHDSEDGAITFESRRKSYMKMVDGETYALAQHPRAVDDEMSKEAVERVSRSAWHEAYASGTNPTAAVEKFAEIACTMYEIDGYHITIGFLFDRAGGLVQMLSPYFADQTEKYIFWYELADMAARDNTICGLIFISEIWIRDPTRLASQRTSDLKIIGEGIQVVAAYEDTCAIKTIPLVKRGDRLFIDMVDAHVVVNEWPNFLVPIKRVWEARKQRK